MNECHVSPPSSGPWSFEQLVEATKRGFSGVLGMTLLEVGSDYARLQLVVDERHTNSVGSVHGGVLMSLADAAGAMACMHNLPPESITSTTDSHTQFLRPAAGSTLYAHAEIVRLGRTRATMLTKISNEEGKLIAMITQAQTIMPKRGVD